MTKYNSKTNAILKEANKQASLAEKDRSVVQKDKQHAASYKDKNQSYQDMARITEGAAKKIMEDKNLAKAKEALKNGNEVVLNLYEPVSISSYDVRVAQWYLAGTYHKPLTEAQIAYLPAEEQQIYRKKQDMAAEAAMGRARGRRY